jgi:hypothetical protein
MFSMIGIKKMVEISIYSGKSPLEKKLWLDDTISEDFAMKDYWQNMVNWQ